MDLHFNACRVGSAQRGEETRRRVLEAAVEAFASVGYEAAHTRLVAQRAGVKLPAISYYFGSKEGLFRAVIEHITGQFEKRMEPITAHVRAGLADASASRDTLLALLDELIHNFCEIMLSPHYPESWRMILVRGEVENVSALHPLHLSIRRLTVEPCKALIARLLGVPESDETVWLRAAALLGQINIFTKPQVRSGLGWTEYTDDRVKAVQDVLHHNVCAIFAASEGEKS